MLQGLLQGELLEENIGGICSLVMLPCCFFFFFFFSSCLVLKRLCIPYDVGLGRRSLVSSQSRAHLGWLQTQALCSTFPSPTAVLLLSHPHRCKVK